MLKLLFFYYKDQVVYVSNDPKALNLNGFAKVYECMSYKFCPCRFQHVYHTGNHILNLQRVRKGRDAKKLPE